jgi:uncharacterized protein YybS (DUF2232 family)
LDLLLVLGLWVLLFGAILAVSGMAILFALLRGALPNVAVLAGSLACAFFFLVLFGLAQLDSKGPNWKDMQTYLQQNLQAQMSTLKSQGIPQDKIDENMDLAQKYGVEAYPAWVVLTCLWFSFLAYYMVPVFFRRYISRIPRPLPFRQWIIPEPFIFGFLIGALLKVGVKYLDPVQYGWMEIVANNLLVFFGSVYIMGGFSIISYYLQKLNIPMIFRFPLYVFLTFLFEPLFCLGVLDVWMDLRKIKTPPLEKTA